MLYCNLNLQHHHKDVSKICYSVKCMTLKVQSKSIYIATAMHKGLYVHIHTLK